jgi:nitrate reductase delta subunit
MGLWSDTDNGRARFGASRAGGGRREAVERLKHWTCDRFHLADDDTIVVTENPRSTPGFPPLETVVGFWTSDGTRHHFRVFKALDEVTEDDVPPSWLKDALAAADGLECECC